MRGTMPPTRPTLRAKRAVAASGSAAGEINSMRLATAPSASASIAAVPPMEWPTIAANGPWRSAMPRSVRAKHAKVQRPSSLRPWPG